MLNISDVHISRPCAFVSIALFFCKTNAQLFCELQTTILGHTERTIGKPRVSLVSLFLVALVTCMVSHNIIIVYYL